MPKEYIEREALIDKSYVITKSTVDNPYGGKSVVDVEDIEDAPVADVVEVVRCKECIHAHELTQPEERVYTNDCIMCTRIHPDGVRTPMLLNDFCSYGERKDGT